LPGEKTVEIVALDSALENFAQTYPRKSQVVELKFFGGLGAKEIAEVLQVSEKTVLRDWNFAKLWLCRELSQDAA
jgi:DNA-directed RNA polymerase specialized sigma24 family protein